MVGEGAQAPWSAGWGDVAVAAQGVLLERGRLFGAALHQQQAALLDVQPVLVVVEGAVASKLASRLLEGLIVEARAVGHVVMMGPVAGAGAPPLPRLSRTPRQAYPRRCLWSPSSIGSTA